MLVISRKLDESILIGDEIEIIVSEVGNDRVKLCINAPREISIMRRELLETRKLNEEASKGSDLTFLQQFKTMAKTISGKGKVESEHE